MAITLETAARNAACNAIVDLVDAGSGAGTMQIGTSGFSTVLATMTLNDPAFGNAATGTATLDVDPAIEDTSADNTGTAAAFRFRDSDTNVIFSGTVGTSGADLNLNTTSITSGGTVSITSFTLTVPATA